MSSDHGELSLLLVSANVGTLFEQPERLLEPWLNTFCGKVHQERPDFVALHCQEVGGKSYMTGMKYVEGFIERLLTSSDLADYSRVRGFVDKDYETKKEFTALGSIYLVHSRVSDAAMWDFSGCRFHPVADKELKQDNLPSDSFHKKLKYPPDFFPQFPWSRKGHIITRWRLRNRVVDIVNIHLFHDASNLESVSQSPSIYVSNRTRALRHTLQTIDDLGLRNEPLFIFGDFNFRVDLHGIVNSHLAAVDCKSSEKDGAVSSMEFRLPECADDDTPALLLEKKRFVLGKSFTPDCCQKVAEWKEFDKESVQFSSLFEQKITFPPSYPFSEDEGVTDRYMTTRAPSWCDRILYNRTAKDLLEEKSSSSVVYDVLGAETEMGDHKPVYLSARLPAGSANSVANNSHGNNIANSHGRRRHEDDEDNNDNTGVSEPAAKRVTASAQSSTGLAAAAAPSSAAAAGMATSTSEHMLHMLILALVYCSTLILIQLLTDVDIVTAIVTILLLAAALLFLMNRSR